MWSDNSCTVSKMHSPIKWHFESPLYSLIAASRHIHTDNLTSDFQTHSCKANLKTIGIWSDACLKQH